MPKDMLDPAQEIALAWFTAILKTMTAEQLMLLNFNEFAHKKEIAGLKAKGCSRSHPHDNPCPDHDLLTQIARLENIVARIRAAAMHPLFNHLEKIATINTILTQA